MLPLVAGVTRTLGKAPWYYDGSVQILIANPFKEAALREVFKRDFYYDHVFSNYGNLLTIAKVFAGGHCGRFYSGNNMQVPVIPFNSN